MLERDVIHAYLKSLSKYLSRLSKPEADEVIREIEGHIYDAIEMEQESGGEANIEGILARLGAPRELASQYTQHVLEGTPPPQGFNPIQQIKKGATKGLWYSMAFFGFSFSMAFGVIAIAKLFFPDSVGVWSASQGNSVVITFSSDMYPQSSELLGFWLLPISLIFAVGIFQLTRRVLAVMKLSMIQAK